MKHQVAKTMIIITILCLSCAKESDSETNDPKESNSETNGKIWIKVESVEPSYARSEVRVPVSVVADPPVRSSIWSQVAGTRVINLQRYRTDLLFDAPDVKVIETLRFQLSVLNEFGELRENEVEVEVRPLSPSGDGYTIHGRADGKGIDLVVVSEGFTAAEKGKFLEAVESFGETFLTEETISVHAQAWNIHAVWAESEESGLTITADDYPVKTKFESVLGCNGIERLICSNVAQIFNLVANATNIPYFDQILLLANTSQYGGSGGAASAYTLAEGGEQIAIHEIAHSFAGLGDEYPLTDRMGRIEPWEPNLTIETDMDRIKWSHWIENPETAPTSMHSPMWTEDSIGLFTIAPMVDSESLVPVHRPAHDSIMRSLGKPFHAVNAEVWAIRVYAVGGVLLSYEPEDLEIDGNEFIGSDINFAVQLLVPEAQEVRWYVNGVLQPGEKLSHFQYGARETSAYSVTASVRDTSGLIRKDNKSLSEKTLIWNVEF